MRWPAVIGVGLIGGDGLTVIAQHPDSSSPVGYNWMGTTTDLNTGDFEIQFHANQQLITPSSHVDTLTLEAGATPKVFGNIENVSASRVDLRCYDDGGTARDPGRYHIVIHDLNNT